MTKKERTGRQIIRETLRITWLVQAGAYTLMQRLNELPQDKTINIMLSLTLWAFGLVGLWFDFLVPEPAGRGGNGRYSGDFCDAGYHRKHNPLCARIIVRADSRKVIGFFLWRKN